MTQKQQDDLEQKIRAFLFPSLLTVLGAILTWGISQILTEVREIRDAQHKQLPLIQENTTNIKLIQRDIQYLNNDSSQIKREIEELKKTIELQ